MEAGGEKTLCLVVFFTAFASKGQNAFTKEENERPTKYIVNEKFS